MEAFLPLTYSARPFHKFITNKISSISRRFKQRIPWICDTKWL